MFETWFQARRILHEHVRGHHDLAVRIAEFARPSAIDWRESGIGTVPKEKLSEWRIGYRQLIHNTTGQTLKCIPLTNVRCCTQVMPNYILIEWYGRYIEICDKVTGESLVQIPSQCMMVESNTDTWVSYNPVTDTITTWRGPTKLWDWANNDMLLTLDYIYMAISPSGRYILIGGQEMYHLFDNGRLTDWCLPYGAADDEPVPIIFINETHALVTLDDTFVIVNVTSKQPPVFLCTDHMWYRGIIPEGLLFACTHRKKLVLFKTPPRWKLASDA
jgi:hypothetical protein